MGDIYKRHRQGTLAIQSKKFWLTRMNILVCMGVGRAFMTWEQMQGVQMVVTYCPDCMRARVEGLGFSISREDLDVVVLGLGPHSVVVSPEQSEESQALCMQAVGKVRVSRAQKSWGSLRDTGQNHRPWQVAVWTTASSQLPLPPFALLPTGPSCRGASSAPWS
jgi:hypothetical protein